MEEADLSVAPQDGNRKSGVRDERGKTGAGPVLDSKNGAYFMRKICKFSFIFSLFTLNSVSLMYNSGTILNLRSQFKV